MGIYYFNDIAESIVEFMKNPDNRVPLFGILIGVILFVTAFIMQGFGLYKMAKNQGLKYKALAFVPFLNVWYMGKLAGKCYFFGHRVKGVSVYAMTAQIVTILLTVMRIVAEVYLRLEVGAPQESDLGFMWPKNLTGMAAHVSTFYDVVGYILPIIQLIFEIFFIVLAMGLYKKYTAKNYMVFSMLTLFIPVSRYFIIFALRNNKAINYEEYIRAQREAYACRQQQYYNQYGNPYNRYGNSPYGNAHYGGNSEPFEEFSSKNNSGSPFEEYGDSDGFFN